MSVNVAKIREDFPALSQTRNGKPPIYFDNACMTLKPNPVIDAMKEYYQEFPACGGHGRSAHWFASKVNERVEEAREIITKLIGAKSVNEIVFTKNTTEGINLVARSFGFKKGDMVLTTDKEHNSNLCPWQFLETKGLIEHDVVPSNQDNTFNLELFEEKLTKLTPHVKLVSMCHTSNLDGYATPAKEIIKIAHDYGALVMLDAAQSVPHKPVDVQKLDVDFLAFSIHKMCGPTGVGILYGKENLLKKLEPFIVGGDTVKDTFYDQPPIYLDPPSKFEAGLQDYAGMIGAGAAAKYLMDIGMNNIIQHEIKLNKHLTENLTQHEEIELIGPNDPKLRGGICTFFAKKKGLSAIDTECDKRNNIMLRGGEFCVHSWFNGRRVNRASGIGSIRASLYLYNTLEECEIFVDTIDEILQEYKDMPIVEVGKVVYG